MERGKLPCSVENRFGRVDNERGREGNYHAVWRIDLEEWIMEGGGKEDYQAVWRIGFEEWIMEGGGNYHAVWRIDLEEWIMEGGRETTRHSGE